MRNRFYFDEIYEATVIRLHDTLAAIAGGIDWFIENACIGFIRGEYSQVGVSAYAWDSLLVLHLPTAKVGEKTQEQFARLERVVLK